MRNGRTAVLVAAIAGDAGGGGKCFVDRGEVLGVEGEGEQSGVVGAVLALAQPCADDDGGHGCLLQHPAGRDIGDRDGVLLGDRGERAQDGLQDVPAAGRLDETAIFLLAPVVDRAGFGPVQPAVGEKAAGKRAVGQELAAVLQAKRGHVFGGAAVEQRDADLIGGNVDVLGGQHAQMVGVGIGHAEVADAAFDLEGSQFVHGVQPGRMLEQPPMELEQVDLVGLQPGAGAIDSQAHHLLGHRAGFRAPFGEGAQAGTGRSGERAVGQAGAQVAGEEFGAAVVIGHVEAVEAVGEIGGECFGALVRVDRAGGALDVGDLPQAGDDARDVQAGGERDAVWVLRQGRDPS